MIAAGKGHSTNRSRVPRGRQLVTLQDAGTYITKLPKSEHEAAEWQARDGSLDPGRDGGRTRYYGPNATRHLS
jgi:hypothetical protein